MVEFLIDQAMKEAIDLHNRNQLDDYNSDGLKAEYLKENIKTKSKNILRKLKNLKKDG